MKVLGRSRLQSNRTKMRRIDRVFERILQLVLILFFVFTLTSMLSNRSAFQIDSITITGAEATGKDHINSLVDEMLSQKFLWKIERNNALFYPKRNLTRAIYELDAHVETVKLSVLRGKQLEIKINEYQPSLLWCQAGNFIGDATSTESCYLADKNGYIYAFAPHYSGYPFIVFRTGIAGNEELGTPIGLSVLSREEFLLLSEFREVLSKKGVVVREVNHQEEQDYKLVTDEGWEVLWSTQRDTRESAENLLAALAEMQNSNAARKATTTPKVIDLRFENKIFYR